MVLAEHLGGYAMKSWGWMPRSEVSVESPALHQLSLKAGENL